MRSLVALLLPVAAAAQVQTGERVRMLSSDSDAPVVGVLASLTTDSVVVRTSSGTTAFATRSVRRVEVSEGMGHAGGHYAAIGAAVGATLGAIGAAAGHEQCSRDNSCFFDEPLPEIIGGAVAAGGLGAGLGYLFGLSKRRERWKRVALQLAPP